MRKVAGKNRTIPGYDPRDLLAPFFLLAGILTLPVALPFVEVRGPITLSVLTILAALAVIGTVGGYYCLSQALNRLPVATAVTITNMSPLAVALISILVYREHLSVYTIVGGVLAVSGCIGTIRADMKKPRPAQGARAGASVK